MDLAHGAKGAGADELDHAPGAMLAVPLVPHLGRHLVFLRGRPHEPGLGDRVGQRFLAVDVSAQGHGHQRGGGMVMIGGGNGDRIEPLLLFQHLAVVGVACGLWIALERRGGPPVVDVAERGDVFAADPGKVGAALAAGADDADVELFAGGLAAREDAETSTEGRAGGERAALEKRSSGKSTDHGYLHRGDSCFIADPDRPHREGIMQIKTGRRSVSPGGRACHGQGIAHRALE